MESFTYHAPTEVRFGRGAEAEAGAFAKKYGRSRVLIVSGGQSAEKSGLLARVEASLDEAGVAHARLTGVHANPLLSKAREGIALARSFGADLILGVGGGSALDTAKCISHGAANDADVWDIWTGKAPAAGTLGIACIPTMAAAGSEMSDSAVITNEETADKRGLGSPLNRPLFALINPELLYTLPRYQTACGAADILMHTLERWFTDVQGNYLTDAVAAAVMRTVVRFGPVLLEQPDNYEAASELFWASCLSHNDLTGLGGRKCLDVHKLGMRLSADYDMAHGASLTCLFGAWARHFLAVDPARFAQLGCDVFGLKAGCSASEGIAAVEQFFRSLGLPVCFSESELGILPDDALTGLADRVTAHGTARWGTFAEIGYDDALAIYRAANH